MIKLDFSTGEAKKEVDSFRSSLKLLGSDTKMTRKEVEGLESKFKNKLQADKTREELTRVAKTTNMTEKEMGQLAKKLGMTKRQFKNLQKESSHANTTLKQLSPSLGNIQKIIGGITFTAITAGIVVFAKKSLAAFKSFESALTDMGKVTGEKLGIIRTKMLEMPAILGNATQLVKGYYQVISAGVTQPKAAMDLLTVASKASRAAHVEQGETIKVLTKLMAGYEGEIKNTTEAADLLFTIEKEGQTSFMELVPLMGDLAAYSKNLNIETSELGGSLALLTQTSGSTAEAATQYKAILTALMKPSADLTKILKNMGFESGEAALKQLGLKGALQGIMQEAEKSDITMGKYLGRVEAISGLTKLAANNFSSLSGKIKAVNEGTGGMDKAFEAWGKTMEGVQAETVNTLERLFILIGEKLAPKMLIVLKSLTTWMEQNEGSLVTFFETAIELIGDFIGGIYNIVQSFQGMKAVMSGKLSFFDYATADAEKLDKLLQNIYNPKQTTKNERLENLQKQLEAAEWSLKHFKKSGYSDTSPAVRDFVSKIKELNSQIANLKNPLQDSWNAAKKLNEELGKTPSRMRDAAKDAIENQKILSDPNVGKFDMYGNPVTPSESPASAMSPGGALKSATSGVTGIGGLGELYIMFVKAIEKLLNLPKRMLDATTSLFNTIGDWGKKFQEALLNFEKGIKNMLENASEILTKGLVQVFRTISNLPKLIFGKAGQEFMREVVDSMPMLMTEFVRGAERFVRGLIENVPKFIKTFVDSAAKALYHAVLMWFGVISDYKETTPVDQAIIDGLEDLLKEVKKGKAYSSMSQTELMATYTGKQAAIDALDPASETYYEDSLALYRQQFEILQAMEENDRQYAAELQDALTSLRNVIGVVSSSQYSLALGPAEMDRMTGRYQDLLAQAQTGAPAAIQEYTDFITTYLDEAQALYASSAEYQAIYAQVMEDLMGLEAETSETLESLVEGTTTAVKEMRAALEASIASLLAQGTSEGGGTVVTNPSFNLMEEFLSAIKEAITGTLSVDVMNFPGSDDGTGIGSWGNYLGDITSPQDWSDPSDIIDTIGGGFFADGAVVNKPTFGVFGEAGPEAIIPLESGNVPVKITGDSGGNNSALLREQNELLRAILQKNQNINLNANIELEEGSLNSHIKQISADYAQELSDRG